MDKGLSLASYITVYTSDLTARVDAKKLVRDKFINLILKEIIDDEEGPIPAMVDNFGLELTKLIETQLVKFIDAGNEIKLGVPVTISKDACNYIVSESAVIAAALCDEIALRVGEDKK